MYTPKTFKNENETELKEFIRKNNFGMLISNHDKRPWATHLPFMLSADGKKLSGHVARGNPHWKQLPAEDDVLVVFQGPHAYISSSWYDHENVPTYNYIAVHVYGKPRIIEGEELVESLRQLVDHHETISEKPVSVDRMTPEYLAKEIRGIVAFEIEITDIQASYKLSQNRDQVNHTHVISKLEKQDDYNAKEIAKEMKIHGHQ